ncbi:hypothetical protein JRQ81_018540 [Phrynocephalus forsythii]|uniref:COMM domain-containing protein 3 n=1 Tax=Phrynocephalus forsythii TaxID=171643 RepID=A0A9Q0XNP1_9SAUR|nr:hypothetical protein JRQ81_018540 [Phrynocephalus forsythii]
MELSASVQGGLQLLADRGRFSPRAYALLVERAFQSLLSGQADQAALDHPDLEQIDPAVLKYCHAAAAACIVEAGKQRADKSTISAFLEDCKFDRDRIEQFCTEYQKNKDNLEILLGSTGRCPLHISDVCWRLEYQIKVTNYIDFFNIKFCLLNSDLFFSFSLLQSNQLHKNYCPTYLVTLNVENSDSRSHPDINFSCSMEQLQDLVGKLKDAAKSLERTTQQ